MRRLTKISLFGIRLGLIVLACYWMAIFAGTHWPEPPDIAPDVSDKVKHFGAYFGLGLLLCYVGKSQRPFRRFGSVAAIGIAYGAFDEITQQFVQGRFPDVMDFLADIAGITTAIVAFLIAKKISSRKTLDRNDSEKSAIENQVNYP